MGHKSRVHQSRFKGASKHGGGKAAPVGMRDGTSRMATPHGRFARHPGGSVPSKGRTSIEQLKYLDSRGFIATKERVKLKKRIDFDEYAAANPPKKTNLEELKTKLKRRKKNEK